MRPHLRVDNLIPYDANHWQADLRYLPLFNAYRQHVTGDWIYSWVSHDLASIICRYTIIAAFKGLASEQ